MLNLAVETWLRFAVWLVVGLVVYTGYGHRNARLAERARAEQPVEPDTEDDDVRRPAPEPAEG